ncbi:hypothetical protein [Psychrobacter sp. I-STPA10]|nr:hypothetical protein [Psychrobacter sp. I-STPA10]
MLPLAPIEAVSCTAGRVAGARFWGSLVVAGILQTVPPPRLDVQI